MTIAILAHDSSKELALQFCTAYSGILSRNTVIATGTTGRMLAQATGLPVHCYLSGKLGGIQQISARVACDEVDLVLFFRDPLKAESGSSSEQNLLRLCDMHSVPISTNIATAEVLLRGLDQGDLDSRHRGAAARPSGRVLSLFLRLFRHLWFCGERVFDKERHRRSFHTSAVSFYLMRSDTTER